MQLIPPHRISTFITCWQHVWQIAFCCGSWGWAICFFSREPCLIHNGIFVFHSLGNSTCMLISYLTPKYIIMFRHPSPPLGGPAAVAALRGHSSILHPWQHRPRAFLLEQGQPGTSPWVGAGGDNWRYLRRKEQKRWPWMSQCVAGCIQDTLCIAADCSHSLSYNCTRGPCPAFIGI